MQYHFLYTLVMEVVNKCAQFYRGGPIDLTSQLVEHQKVLEPLKKNGHCPFYS